MSRKVAQRCFYNFTLNYLGNKKQHPEFGIAMFNQKSDKPPQRHNISNKLSLGCHGSMVIVLQTNNIKPNAHRDVVGA
eukprot:1503680-Amphidinium_carterae.1